MGKKVLFFDFDGTIVDNLNLSIKIINDLSDHYKYKKIKREEISLLRDKKSRDILKYLGISAFKTPFVAKRIRKEMNKEIGNMKTKVKIKSTLLKLKNKGIKIGILTNNSEENVVKFLRKNNLNVFDFIYCENSIFGKSKTIKHALKKMKIKPEEAAYIGDEVRDIEAARKRRMEIVVVSWGFNSKKILKKHKPDFLINNPNQLTKIF